MSTHESDSEALIGLEVIKLDPDPRAPWQMTVDAWVNGEIVRYQLRGVHYTREPRTPDDFARGGFKPDQAEKMDALDRKAGAEIAEIITRLQREQVYVLYGDKGLAFLDRGAE